MLSFLNRSLKLYLTTLILALVLSIEIHLYISSFYFVGTIKLLMGYGREKYGLFYYSLLFALFMLTGTCNCIYKTSQELEQQQQQQQQQQQLLNL